MSPLTLERQQTQRMKAASMRHLFLPKEYFLVFMNMSVWHYKFICFTFFSLLVLPSKRIQRHFITYTSSLVLQIFVPFNSILKLLWILTADFLLFFWMNKMLFPSHRLTEMLFYAFNKYVHSKQDSVREFLSLFINCTLLWPPCHTFRCAEILFSILKIWLVGW